MADPTGEKAPWWLKPAECPKCGGSRVQRMGQEPDKVKDEIVMNCKCWGCGHEWKQPL